MIAVLDDDKICVVINSLVQNNKYDIINIYNSTFTECLCEFKLNKGETIFSVISLEEDKYLFFCDERVALFSFKNNKFELLDEIHYEPERVIGKVLDVITFGFIQ